MSTVLPAPPVPGDARAPVSPEVLGSHVRTDPSETHPDGSASSTNPNGLPSSNGSPAPADAEVSARTPSPRAVSEGGARAETEAGVPPEAPVARSETGSGTAKPMGDPSSATAEDETATGSIRDALALKEPLREPELDISKPAHLSLHEDLMRSVEESWSSVPAPASASGGVVPASEKAEPHPVAISTDPVTRACQFVVSHFEGLHYLDLAKLVDVIRPEPAASRLEGRPAKAGRAPIPAPPALPRDLTGALTEAKIARLPGSDGRMVLAFRGSGDAVALRHLFAQDQYGYVYGMFGMLVRSTLPFEASVPIRRGLLSLAVLLGQDNEDLGAEILGAFVARAAGGEPGAVSDPKPAVKRAAVRMLAEVMDRFFAESGTAGAVRRVLGDLVSANRPEFALAVVAGIKSLPASDRCDWLGRVACENGGGGRALVEAELWWRLTGKFGANQEVWSEFRRWCRRRSPDGDGFVVWARSMARRVLAWHAAEGALQPSVYGVLGRIAGMGHEAGAAAAGPASRVVAVLAGVQPGAAYALGTALDAMHARDGVAGKLALDGERYATLPVRFPWFGGFESARIRGSRPSGESRQGGADGDERASWFRWDEPGVVLMLTEIAWRLGQGAEAEALRFRRDVADALQSDAESRVAVLRGLTDACRDLLRYDRAIERVAGLSPDPGERAACRRARLAVRGKWKAAAELRAMLRRPAASDPDFVSISTSTSNQPNS